MKSLLLLFNLLFVLSLCGQKPEVIKLKYEEIFNLTDFKIEQVIDKRFVTDNIGFAQKGMGNRRVAAVFPKDLESYLLEVFDHICGGRAEGTFPIVAIIHEFNVSEQTLAFKELGTFRIQIEFAIRENEQLYSLAYFEEQKEGSGMDVTKGHHRRILETLYEIILQLEELDFDKAERSLVEETPVELAYDYSNPSRDGVYASYAKFVQDEPFLEDGYRITTGDQTKFIKYFIKTPDDKFLKKRIWGFTKNDTIYLNASRYSYESHFVKAKQMGKLIYFEDRFADPYAGAMFGLLGHAASNKANGIILDTDTGLVTKMDEVGIKNVFKDHPDVLEVFEGKYKIKLKDIEDAVVRYNAKFK